MPGPACTRNTCYLNQEPCRVWGVLGRAAQLWTQGQLVPSFCRYDLASSSAALKCHCPATGDLLLWPAWPSHSSRASRQQR